MYGKIFESMYDGTLATNGPWQALVTFQQLIVLANPDGIVDMTPKAISRRTSIPLEIIETGLQALMQPDPDSRTPNEDGRRIVLIDDHRSWGWQLVNHEKYAKMRKQDDRREYLREAQRKRRERLKAQGVDSQQLKQKINKSTHTDSYSDSDSDAKKNIAPSSLFPDQVPSPKPPPAFDGQNAELLNGKAIVPIAQSFDLPTDWGVAAEALGWKPAEVLREAERFKQYWTAGNGKDKRRTVKGWRQAWSNWLSKAAEDTRR